MQAFDLLATTDFFTQGSFTAGEKECPCTRELKEISDTVLQHQFVIGPCTYVKDGVCPGIFKTELRYLKTCWKRSSAGGMITQHVRSM